MPDERCNDELDWGEVGHFCERQTGHEPPHRHTVDDPARRPYRVEWWERPSS